MNFKDITSSISETEAVPAGTVRKISKALLKRIGEAIDNGEKLQLPGLIFTPRTIPAREAKADKPALPEKKGANIRRRTVKTKDSDE